MYMDQLAVKSIAVENIYLDPNNPRFWSGPGQVLIAEKKIIDDKSQIKAQNSIDTHDIEDLYNSILRNGFLLLDRIVVRPIKGSTGKYVVVEGNRRFRSLNRLRKDLNDGLVDEDNMSAAAQAALLNSTNKIEVLVYSGGGTDDISWMLQGIRHISGIKGWEPAQRAKLVAEQIDTHGKSLREAGQQFGLSAIRVGRLYRSFKAIKQMQEDEEYGGKAKNNFFTLFEEAIRNQSVKDWLGWKDEDYSFHNLEKLRKFYSWITPDDENNDKRRLHDPRQVKKLGYLISEGYETLLDEIDAHDINVDDAELQARSGGIKPKDWRKLIDNAAAIVKDLPSSAMFEEPNEMTKKLLELQAVITKRLKVVSKIADAD